MDAEIPFVDLVSQHAALRPELMQAFADALDSGSFVGGAALAAFESEFAKFVGTRFAVGVGSGTDALRLGLLALDVKPGDRVITVPNTFVATTAAITQVGAQIDFIDIDPATCLLDPNLLEDRLKLQMRGSKQARPTAVIPVHLYGQCADMDPILELAARYDLRVLEDAAQAHGAIYKGRMAGSMGHAAAFSFYPAKNLGACGEAGAVVANDPAVARQLAILRDHGQEAKYHHVVEAYNSRLDAVQAAILRIKLRHLGEWNAARRAIAKFYYESFQGIPWIRPVVVGPHNESCHHLYVIHVAGREALREHLQQRGVATGLHYPLPLHLQPCYARLGFKPGAFPHAEQSAAELLSIPMFPELDLGRARRVVDAVLSFRA